MKSLILMAIIIAICFGILNVEIYILVLRLIENIREEGEKKDEIVRKTRR